MLKVPVGATALFTLASLAAIAAPSVDAQSVDQVEAVCMDCHPEMEGSRLEALAHADTITCRSCHHLDYTNDPEEARSLRVEQCTSCHEENVDPHGGSEGEEPECTACHSIHRTPATVTSLLSVDRCRGCHEDSHPDHVPGNVEAPVCVDCHTLHLHARPAVDDPASEACAACHEEIHPGHDPATGRSDDDTLAEAFDTRLSCTSCHAPDEGFGVAPEGALDDVCADCHDDRAPAHDDHEEDVSCVSCHDFTAPLSGSGGDVVMTQRCAGCHPDPLDSLRMGGHARSEGPVPAPQCVGCHAAHGTGGEARAAARRIEATVRCIQCHEEQAEISLDTPGSEPASSYEADFHGATVRFLALEGGGPDGAPPVMLCTDCHGAHQVVLIEESEIGPVCGECHEGRDDLLAGAWIGHGPVGPSNALPVWLVRLFYAFLIPFMLGGLFLVIVFQFVDQKRKGARIATVPGVRNLVARFKGRAQPSPTVVRFSLTERLEHLGSMITFILLVVTGLPQTRPDMPVAQWFVNAFGGIWMTRLVHRIVGVAFVVLMVTHVVRAIRNALRKRRVPVMVPRRNDFRDVIQTFRHYLFGKPMPKVGKFDFAQKFEYWGLFLGAIVMSGSGLVLMFPEVVTQLLPGIIVAAIRMMHGLEATFAVMVVVLWHSYGVILRPEIFPLDTTIFTGRMRVDRLKHEHALEYERLFPNEAGD